MDTQTLTQKLDFISRRKSQDEAALLVQAVQAGVEALYREALVDAYLMGEIERDRALRELGPDLLDTVDAQRDALHRDVAWGLQSD